MSSVMRQFQDNSYLFGGNAPFIEDLYEKYLSNPQSVPEEWREYFDRMQVLPGSTVKDIARAPVEQSFVERAKAGVLGGTKTLRAEPSTPERLQVAALLLVTAYRISGARWATVDPLKRMARPAQPELEPGFYDLAEADLDQTVNAGSFVGLDQHHYATCCKRCATPIAATSATSTCSSPTGCSGSGSRSASSRCAAC